MKISLERMRTTHIQGLITHNAPRMAAIIGLSALGLSLYCLLGVSLSGKENAGGPYSSGFGLVEYSYSFSSGSIPLPVYLKAGESYLEAQSAVLSFDEVMVDGVTISARRTQAVVEEDCQWYVSPSSKWYSYELFFGANGTYFRDNDDLNVLYVYYIREDWKTIIVKYRYRYRDGKLSGQYNVKCNRQF